ncbi:MAG TPA: glycoside hydrolase family 3 C-terminal domain-containing protein [Verrucomicrobiae bacterium]|jgi:beta-glucosidase|nr:glycoside hydrolase family 3 C-terminal domain-containing protein [Verrucomicrobiae bacterium]
MRIHYASLVPIVAASIAFQSLAGNPEPNPLTVPLAAQKPLYLDTHASVDARVADLVSRMTLEEKGIALDHDGPDLERFGLRSDKWNQCLHGVWWTEPTTMFPVSIAMAATWDTNLVHAEAVAISDEARAINNGWHSNPNFPGEHKGLIYRAPVINISRNPYWGRINECFGEDPYLTGRIGVAYVTGLQGDDPHYLKLAATLKHFAVNNVERDRRKLSARVPERMLYEYWFPHWRDCIVEGKASSVMASYNAINGTPDNINRWLLTDVLKDAWHHDGFVVSDLGGVNTMVNGHFKSQLNYADAVAESLMAGCDFSDKEFRENIPAAVREGKLSEARLDDAVSRVMRVRMRLGEFDPPQSNPYSRISTNVICCPEHRQLALQAAREAIVLLENKHQFLPLNPDTLKTIAVIGPLADTFIPGGYSGVPDHPVKPLDGIRSHAPGVEILHVQSTVQDAVDAAKRADAVILVLGTTTAIEAEDRDRRTLGLPRNQESLAEAVISANPRTVVVLMSAGPLTVPWLAQHARAMMQAWWPGEEGGDAIADVIFGRTNPGGHLPYTIYASEAQVPPQDEYDISKGFTYMYVRGKPLYPFGYGLSYSKFKYSNFRVSPQKIPGTPDSVITATVDIKNISPRAGDDVAQLYTREIHPSVVRPRNELRGFQRITLQPGEKKSVAFTVPIEKLAFYDESQHALVTEPGQYEIQIGDSSADIQDQAHIQVTSPWTGEKMPPVVVRQ